MAFHWKDGWFFERVVEPNPAKYAWVRIFHRLEMMKQSEDDPSPIIPELASAEVLSFERWREYLEQHDPDGSRNLWGFALPMMAEAFKAGREASIEIEPNSWASIVASVSEGGETAQSFAIAKALHGVLSYMA